MAQKIKETITTKSQLKANPVFTKYLENIKDEKDDYLTLIDMVFPNEEITGYDFKKNHTKGNFEKYVQKTYPEVYNNYTKILSSPYGKMVKEGSDWYKNHPYTPKYDVNSDEAKAVRASSESKAAIISETAKNYGERVSRGVEWNKNNPQTSVYDVNSAELKAARIPNEERLNTLYKKTGFAKNLASKEEKQKALIDFAEADQNIDYVTPEYWEKAREKRRQAYEEYVYNDSKIDWSKAEKTAYRNSLYNEELADYAINDSKVDWSKSKKLSFEDSLKNNKVVNNPKVNKNILIDKGLVEYAGDDSKVDWGKSEKLSFEDSLRPQDLKKRIDAIENNESVKKTLNFTTRSDGSMSYSSKKDYEAAQKFINEQEAEYVNKYTNRLKNDAKYKLDEKISSFVNNKNWEKEFGGMGAQQKVGLMSNLTEAQINMVKKKGLDLENIANWSEEQMGSVVKGLKEAEYMNDVRENLTREFREGVNQRANLAGYNKIASRESSVASEMSKKMSGFKSVGKLAIGGALMYGLISALSDSGGQQSNAQLYGQQPLY